MPVLRFEVGNFMSGSVNDIQHDLCRERFQRQEAFRDPIGSKLSDQAPCYISADMLIYENEVGE